jgi:hypothetical protein
VYCCVYGCGLKGALNRLRCFLDPILTHAGSRYLGVPIEHLSLVLLIFQGKVGLEVDTGHIGDKEFSRAYSSTIAMSMNQPEMCAIF